MRPIKVPDPKSPNGTQRMRRILERLQNFESVDTLPENWLVDPNFWHVEHPKFIAEIGIETASARHLFLFCKDGRVLYTPSKKPRHQRELRGGWHAGLKSLLIHMEETMDRTMDQLGWRRNILPGIADKKPKKKGM